jgi:hypothetical protein
MSSSKVTARVAIVLALISILAIPVAAVLAWKTSLLLLRSLYVAVPVAIVCGLVALSLSRRARYRLDRSVRRAGERIVRTSRWLAWSGLYVGVTGALALVFYGVLRARS